MRTTRAAWGVLRVAPLRGCVLAGSLPERSIKRTPGISSRQLPARSYQLQPCSCRVRPSWETLAVWRAPL